jgi:hypothetical protein
MTGTTRQVPLAKAAELVGVSRPTLYRYALAGKLTTTVNADGVKLVDLAELAKVFPDFKPEPDETTELEQLMAEVRGEIALSRIEAERRKQLEATLFEMGKELITAQAVMQVHAHKRDKAMTVITRVNTIIVVILTACVLALVARSIGYF